MHFEVLFQDIGQNRTDMLDFYDLSELCSIIHNRQKTLHQRALFAINMLNNWSNYEINFERFSRNSSIFSETNMYKTMQAVYGKNPHTRTCTFKNLQPQILRFQKMTMIFQTVYWSKFGRV